jgi:hypothetical protein
VRSLAGKIIAPDTPYVELKYRQALALSTTYQAGIVAWVAFWAFYGRWRRLYAGDHRRTPDRPRCPCDRAHTTIAPPQSRGTKSRRIPSGRVLASKRSDNCSSTTAVLHYDESHIKADVDASSGLMTHARRRQYQISSSCEAIRACGYGQVSLSDIETIVAVTAKDPVPAGGKVFGSTSPSGWADNWAHCRTKRLVMWLGSPP